MPQSRGAALKSSPGPYATLRAAASGLPLTGLEIMEDGNKSQQPVDFQ